MYRVGIDLIEIADVRASLQRFGDRYLARIFSPSEARECGSDPVRLAERFAAKEAAVKALGHTDEDLDLRTIEVSTAAGAPASILLSGAAAHAAERCGMAQMTLSMAHNADHATAIVVLEGHR